MELLHNIAQILLVMSLIYTTALIDANHFKNGQFFKSHKDRLLQRGIIGSIIVLINPLLGLIYGSLYISTFDQILNKLRKLDFWYLGTEANWDIYWNKKLSLYKIIKVTIFVVTLVLITLKFIL